MNTSIRSSPGFHQLVQGPFETTCEHVCTVLKAAGFEILAEINLAEFLSRKSQSYIRPSKIMVVCNPDIARRALTVSPDVGVLLPYHVAVSQTQDDQVEVGIADPHITWNTAANVYLKPIADELNMRFEQVITVLKG